MPIYEYRCRKCRKEFEIVQKFSDKPLTRCPSCAGSLSKLISNCSFQLKGTGWYVTDYKKSDTGGKKKTSEPKKGESTKSESSGSTSEKKT